MKNTEKFLHHMLLPCLFLVLTLLCASAAADKKVIELDNRGSRVVMQEDAVFLTKSDVSSMSENGDSYTLTLVRSASELGLTTGKQFVWMKDNVKPYFVRVDSIADKTVQASSAFTETADSSDNLITVLAEEFREFLDNMLGPEGSWQQAFSNENTLKLGVQGYASLEADTKADLTFTITREWDDSIHIRAETNFDYTNLNMDIAAISHGELVFPVFEFPLTPAGEVGPKLELALVLSGEGAGEIKNGNIYNTYVSECYIHPGGIIEKVTDPEKPIRPENSFEEISGDLDIKLGMSASLVPFDFLLNVELSAKPGFRIKMKMGGDEGGNPGKDQSAEEKVETWHYCRTGECFHGAIMFEDSVSFSIGVTIKFYRLVLVELEQPLFTVGLFSFYQSNTFGTGEFRLDPSIHFFDNDIPSICPYIAYRLDVTAKSKETQKVLPGSDIYVNPSFADKRAKDGKVLDDKVLFNTQNKTDSKGKATVFVPTGQRTAEATVSTPKGYQLKGTASIDKKDKTESLTVNVSDGMVSVTFKPNTDKQVTFMPPDQTGHCGELIQLWGRDGSNVPQRPAADGCQFVGWSTDPKASPDSPDLLTSVYSEFIGNETLYAIWRDVFTVRFLNWNGEELWLQTKVPYGTRYGTKEHPYYGKPTTKEEDIQYTYHFAGFDPVISTPITADMTFTAMYEAEPKQYHVTWMLDEKRPLSEDTFGYHETPVYNGPLPTKASSGKTRYVFSGWDPAPAPITGEYPNTYYYAQFIEVKEELTVLFDSAGGSPHPNGQTVAYGGVAVRPETDPERLGYIFRAWLLNGKEYDFSKLVYDDLTLTAGWDAVKYTFTSGAGQSWQRGSNTGASFTVKRNADDRKTFSLFSDVQLDGSSIHPELYTITEGSLKLVLEPGFLESLDSGRHTLTVHFLDGQASTTFNIGFDPRRFYTITWTDDTGTVLEKDEMIPAGSMPEYNGKTPRKPSAATESYVFAGWTPEIVPVSSDAVYRAVFAMKTEGFSVRFEAEGGAPVPPVQIVASGEKVTRPQTDPVRNGYEFTGWQLNEALYDFDQPVLFNLTLHAAWSPVSYKVTSGDGQSWRRGSNGGIYFLAERNMLSKKTWPLFKGLRVDGKRPAADAWKAYPGPDFVEIELYPDFLESLGNGTHRLSVLFMDGQADASFNILFDTRDIYTVIWVDDNGFVLEKDETVTEGTVPQYHSGTPAKAPTAKETYQFTGWTPEPVPAVANAVYIAVFQAIPLYHVTFDAKGGQPVPAVQTIVDGDHAIQPDTVPARENYLFLGWQLDGVSYNFDTPVHSDLTLLAKWQKQVPRTGDNQHPEIWILSLVCGLVIMGVLQLYRVNHKKKGND